jgi:hypothetical protein
MTAMRTRIQAKRKTAGKEPQKPWAKLQPRPFGAEGESDAATAPLNQAQVDRIAHAPNMAGMPLYSPEQVAASNLGGAAIQAKQSAESNLKSPQGTLQRQVEDQKAREDELVQKAAEPAKEDEDMLQMQAAPVEAEEETLQTQLEEKTEEAVQEKAEVGAEVEKDEAVQAELETESEETLQRQAEAAEAEEDVVETEQELAIAQDKEKS